MHAPAILGAEVVSALRSMLRRGLLTAHAAEDALRGSTELRTRSYAFAPLATRVWELRENVTVYDGWYVALAEALDATLVTSDERLRRAAGPRCPVRSPAEIVAEP